MIQEEEMKIKEDDVEKSNGLKTMMKYNDLSGKTKLNNKRNKTLELIQEDYELRKDFLKKLSKLKEESVSKKNR